MHKDKEENSHHDSHYRARELAAFAAYDHHHLDGEMFLQVSSTPLVYSFVSFSDPNLIDETPTKHPPLSLSLYDSELNRIFFSLLTLLKSNLKLRKKNGPTTLPPANQLHFQTRGKKQPQKLVQPPPGRLGHPILSHPNHLGRGERLRKKRRGEEWEGDEGGRRGEIKSSRVRGKDRKGRRSGKRGGEGDIRLMNRL